MPNNEQHFSNVLGWFHLGNSLPTLIWTGDTLAMGCNDMSVLSGQTAGPAYRTKPVRHLSASLHLFPLIIPKARSPRANRRGMSDG